jgi:GntR family transcriptional regulator
MPGVSSRALYERRRAKPSRTNNSIRRTYDLLRSSLPLLGSDARLVEEELVDALSASRNTVRAVLQLLAEQGLVTRGPKVGTLVSGSTVLPVDEVMTFPEFAEGCPTGTYGQVIESQVITAPPIVRQRLELPAGAEVLLTDGLVLEGTTPLAVSVCYLGLVPSEGLLATGQAPDAVALLEESLHVGLGTGSSVVAAVAADAQTAGLLGIADGAPILWCEDLLNDLDGRPRALSQLRFRGDRVTFTATTHRRPLELA